MQLRCECAINPPTLLAGRLIAVWIAQPAPGQWELSYWNGEDGSGVTRRFEWHAQSAAARLGFGETGQKAVWFWLDRVRRDAPESHIRPQLIEGPDGTEQLYSVEILDICGLSAEYCIRCEADQMAAFQAELVGAPADGTLARPEQPDATSALDQPEAVIPRPASGNSDPHQESYRPTNGHAGEQVSLITPSPPGSERLIRRSGDFWQLAFGGKSRHIRNLKGLVYILHLLHAPGQSFYSVQLYSAAAGQKEQPVIGSAGEVADQKAVEEYRTRIEDLETRLSEAERNNDEAQKEAIQWEKDSLDEQILKACGFHGRQRKASDDAERFRKGVSMAIDRAIDAIREHHAPLADHLRLRIKCGNFFCYHPDGIPWEF